MDWETIVAIIAALISVIAAIDAHLQNKNINQINLKAGYFNEIYKDYLIYKFPKARSYIQFIDGKLTGIDRLVDEMNSMRHDSLYFYFSDKKFYDNLKIEMQKLEDYLFIRSEEFLTSKEQRETFETIEKYMNEIYKCITAKYLGKQLL